MKKFYALVRARNLEFYRDRTSLAWTLLFPFIVLAGFTYGYAGKQEPLLRALLVSEPGGEGGASAPRPASLNAALDALRNTPGLDIQAAPVAAKAHRKLERFETDLVLTASDDGQHLVVFMNRDSDKSRLAERIASQTVASSGDPKLPLETREITGKKIRYVDWLLPGLLAMNIMFGSMFGVGYVIVRYRKNGVLKRLRATPLSAFQFLTAQVVSRMFLMIFTSLIVVIGSILLIGFTPPHGVGAWIDLVIFLCVSSTAMISVGLVVAARIASEEVADGVLNLMTWPMIFLSGIWFAIDGASGWVLFIAKLMPLTHVVTGLRALLIDGEGLHAVLSEIGILAAVTVVLTSLGAAIFKWR